MLGATLEAPATGQLGLYIVVHCKADMKVGWRLQGAQHAARCKRDAVLSAATRAPVLPCSGQHIPLAQCNQAAWKGCCCSQLGQDVDGFLMNSILQMQVCGAAHLLV